MKSRLFTTIFDDSKSDAARQFSRHLQDLLELRDEDRSACLASLQGVHFARTEVQKREAIDVLARSRDLEQHTIAHAVSVLIFFLDALLVEHIPDDDWTYWTADLRSLKWLSKENQPIFESILDRLVAKLPDLRLQHRELSTAGGVLPTFTSFGFTIEARPIRREIFRWGRNVEEYVPEILGTTVLASVHVGVDVGPIDDFYFQADEVSIDNMIATLLAAKKEIAAFRAYLNIPEEG